MFAGNKNNEYYVLSSFNNTENITFQWAGPKTRAIHLAGTYIYKVVHYAHELNPLVCTPVLADDGGCFHSLTP
jgi:hypothetical protein